MLEKTIEMTLCKLVRAKGGLALKFVSPGTVGVPDRLILLPDGRINFVELKAPGKKPSAKQVKMAEVLARLGHPVRIIDSMEGVKEFINEI
ncbi:VRR-NUC domain protein [Desulfosporosinus acididurans]|uniref:VRR-NUC domain protein n=1 Tax=Desulfosporosinus acididurans TaxID=476652 RepID=A0A0J1FRT3_9FIRM|nr:VRR-NUC domain-containing protein [Desulfosporosinus acididurans]KLU65703.1 VRR-NUC domain protein [Desulfosporosinus acididurans]